MLVGVDLGRKRGVGIAVRRLCLRLVGLHRTKGPFDKDVIVKGSEALVCEVMH